MNELVNRADPEHCKSYVSTFGAAADVRLNECWGVQPKLPALAHMTLARTDWTFIK